MSKKLNLGQYFTTDLSLQKKVYEFIKNNPKLILEPSVGQGHLISYINSQNKNIKFDCYEIDQNIQFLPIISKQKITFGDFIIHKFEKVYQSIVGNPPYVKTKKGNLYIDFINKCIDLLDLNGELILIIPSDFFKLTSAIPTIKKMLDNGHITDVYHPHNENLFKNASIDVIIFRFVKTKEKLTIPYLINYNDSKLNLIESGGLVTFSKDKKNKGYKKLEELFNIYVGIVNGKEKVYKTEIGNITVLNKENVREKYIYIKKFPDKNKKINNHLLKYKSELLKRKIKKFNENNWFEWGAPRNISVMENKRGMDCLYVKNLTRSKNVCFRGKVEYFGGSLIILIPKKNMELDILDKIMEEINKESYQFLYSGRYKIGHRQLCKLLINVEGI